METPLKPKLSKHEDIKWLSYEFFFPSSHFDVTSEGRELLLNMRYKIKFSTCSKTK
ncbi:hypothetical protein EXN66_Car013878 [Channa argus]|uniref:Uncharacterized protein n=1 Tax=Channa argus TaxID=215402 RepID=A0A6G1Q6R3_CHAAH|nr:hypothetical protein EXN66_Car013878 [Channa argus]